MRYARSSCRRSLLPPAILGPAVVLSIASLAFSLVNAFLLRPLPVRNGGDLVAFSLKRPALEGL